MAPNDPTYHNDPEHFSNPSDSGLFNDLLPVRYGSFWERLGAIIIDGIIIGVAASILNSVLGLGVSRETLLDADSGMIYNIYWKSNITSLILQWLYFSLMESSAKQATLGKMALGLKVTDLSGQRISFINATGRYFGKILSGIILLIGYLMVLWDDKRQALHDKLAGTLVVKK